MTWDQAEAYCVSQGSHLATIKDSTDRDETKALCQSKSPTYGCWIGLHHEDSASEWQWADGSSLDYAFDSNGNPTTGVDPWHTNEPNSDGEDCIHLLNSHYYNWNDK